MTVLAVILGGAWIACGVLAYGITLAEFQRSYPLSADGHYRSDCARAVSVACFGPVGAIVAYTLSGFACHGLMYRRRRS